MLEAVGCTVVFLRQVAFGGLVLDKCLAPGGYRPLTPAELDSLGCTSKIIFFAKRSAIRVCSDVSIFLRVYFSGPSV